MKQREPTRKQEARLHRAAENLKRIEGEIAPYTKPREVISISTAGQWAKPTGQAAARELTRRDFLSVLARVSKPLADPHDEENSETYVSDLWDTSP